jgi:hypothetical protein
MIKVGTGKKWLLWCCHGRYFEINIYALMLYFCISHFAWIFFLYAFFRYVAGYNPEHETNDVWTCDNINPAK